MALSRLNSKEFVQKLNQHPVEAGTGLIITGLLLKTTFIIKLISYALITCGLVFLWKAIRPHLDDPNEGNNTNV